MVLKTPDVLGPHNGYGIARRARFYSLTAAIIARFFEVRAEDLS